MFIPLRHPLHNLNLTIRAPSKAWDHDCVCLYMPISRLYIRKENEGKTFPLYILFIPVHFLCFQTHAAKRHIS